MKCYALCIGNTEYNSLLLGKLPAARNDAEAIGGKLCSLGFTVDTEYNLKSRDMAIVIGGLEEKVKQYDSVLFYYAGHGFEVDGNNILAPIDLNPSDEKSAVLYDAYKLSDLMEILKGADNQKIPKTKIIILDACRTQLNVRGSSPYFGPILAPQGAIIAFSTSPGQTAHEKGMHGVYTNTLLRYMDTPRTSIERVFKRVRTALVNETKGAQIPWEHTSLIGDYYLNPQTIYDGSDYSKEALADSEFIFPRNSKMKDIVCKLKSYNYYTQSDALKEFWEIPKGNMEEVLSDELFVFGRNIYQAACGGCFDCERFIKEFAMLSRLSNDAKKHILNGMAFEIYYDSKGQFREKAKFECSQQVIELLEREEYYGSLRFINSFLDKEDKIYYYPGQDDKIEVSVEVSQSDIQESSFLGDECEGESNVVSLKDILYNGVSIYADLIDSRYLTRDSLICDICKITRKQFENYLLDKMLVANGYLIVSYFGAEIYDDTEILI